MAKARETASRKRTAEESPVSSADASTVAADSHDGTIQIVETDADIFKCSSDAVIVHACNCLGSWGKGFALALKSKFPAAHRRYVDFCADHKAAPADLRGKAQLAASGSNASPGPWIGCLFTKTRSGATASHGDTADRILSNTKDSFENLLQLVVEERRRRGKNNGPGEIHMPKINSGLFAVPWEKTRDVLENATVPQGAIASADNYAWTVYVHSSKARPAKGQSSKRQKFG